MKTVLLHGRKALGRVALVDDGDWDLVSGYRWFLWENPRGPGKYMNGPYAMTNERCPGGWRKRKMHTLLTGWPLTDHIDTDGLNNRRSNLRTATRQQNLGNTRKRRGGTSRYKGVAWNAKDGKWRARMTFNGVATHLGMFADEEAAARAYDAAAREKFGEYARMNF